MYYSTKFLPNETQETNRVKTEKTPQPHTPDNDHGEETTHFGFTKVPVREKAGYVLRHFTSIAVKYDFMNTILSLGLHYLWKRLSVNALGLRPGARVIDVCGGTADLSILAAKAVGRHGRVVLIDINRAMMDGGKPKVVRAGVADRISYVQGDAECMALPDSSFDAAMVGFGIRNLTDMDKGLSEMYRVLRPGARMMCLEFSLPTSFWFRPLYDFYSFVIMPLAGMILTGNRDAYLYLPESIRKFPSPDDFAAMMANTGFSRVTYRRLTMGIAVIYVGVKP
jgi:demethylmenaquinone methyltransferase / 2-methoxy-6-polyprenyl-1,4-benzoquinol methylase